jgi:hypothetical protein
VVTRGAGIAEAGEAVGGVAGSTVGAGTALAAAKSPR